MVSDLRLYFSGALGCVFGLAGAVSEKMQHVHITKCLQWNNTVGEVSIAGKGGAFSNGIYVSEVSKLRHTDATF